MLCLNGYYVHCYTSRFSAFYFPTRSCSANNSKCFVEKESIGSKHGCRSSNLRPSANIVQGPGPAGKK